MYLHMYIERESARERYIDIDMDIDIVYMYLSAQRIETVEHVL